MRGIETLAFLDLVDLPVRIMRARFGPLYRVALYGTALATLPSLIVLFFTFDSMLAPSPMDPFLQLAGAAATFALGFIGQIALFHAVGEVLAGREPSVGAAFRLGFAPGPYFSCVLQMVAILVGLLFCCFPGVVGMIAFALVPAAIVEERARFFDALVRSWNLVFHRAPDPLAGGAPMWLRVAGVFLVSMLIAWSLNMLGAIVPATISVVLVLRGAASGEIGDGGVVAALGWMQIGIAIVGVFITSLAQLYTTSALALLFRHARETREGPALEARVKARVAELTP